MQSELTVGRVKRTRVQAAMASGTVQSITAKWSMPFNSHEGYNDKNHGPTAKLVYRPPTVPMDYTVFASTNPISKDQNVDEDLNIESVSI